MTGTMKAIIEHCRLKGISQSELAKRSGITEKSISLYFNDKHTPNVEYVEDMAKALGMELVLDEFRIYQMKEEYGELFVIPKSGIMNINGYDIDVNKAALKQVPKPKHKYQGFRCVCGTEVAKHQMYCDECGQRLLDWSE